MLTGQKLMEDVEAFAARGQTAPEKRVAFWWLGQLGYLVKLGEAVLAFDPFLSPGEDRRYPPQLAAEDLAGVDYILGSHDHSDHIDRPVWKQVAKLSEKPRFVVPKLLAGELSAELGIPRDRFIGLDEGIAHRDEAKGLALGAVPAAHEFLDESPEGLHPYLGYVAEWNGLRVVHTGDSCKYEGLEARLKDLGPIDLLFLPINGRDGRRFRSGCIGNMDFREAVDLVGAVAPRLAAPGHYDMFANNSEDPMRFADYLEAKYPARDFWIGGHGVRVERDLGAPPQTPQSF